MNRVAVFGNAGAGKTTLAMQLSELTGIPLYSLDIVQFRAGRYWPEEKNGGKIPHDEYLRIHADLLKQDRWIIDGYGCSASTWERLAVADTLVYIDLPLLTHYTWVTMRLARGLLRNPAGWPANSPVWRSSLDSYRVVRQCDRHLAPKYRQMVQDSAASKRVYHLKSPAQMKAFLAGIERDLHRN